MVTERDERVVAKPIEKVAGDAIRERSQEFAADLILEAKQVAQREDADVVLRNHVERAAEILKGKRRRSRVRDFLAVIGGACLGAFVQGFIDALSDDSQLLVVVYVIIGFAGLTLVLVALWGDDTFT